MTDARSALIDTNVIVGALVEDHPHYIPSAAILRAHDRIRLCVSTHCLSETFVVLTRHGPAAPFGWSAEEALAAVEFVARITSVTALSAAQSQEAIRLFAQSGGVGTRLYDYLIGRAAVMAGAQAIVTWNVKHMRALFPALAVVTPPEFIGTDQPTSR